MNARLGIWIPLRQRRSSRGPCKSSSRSGTTSAKDDDMIQGPFFVLVYVVSVTSPTVRGGVAARALRPGAEAVTLVSGDLRVPLSRAADGMFAGALERHPGAYELEVDYGNGNLYFQ